MKKKKIFFGLRRGYALFLLFFGCGFFNGTISQASDKSYVGAEKCAECHESEYKNFTEYAKKSNSFHSIQIMKKGLTNQELKSCFECHTTGYGESGGFKSENETPHLKNAGCEVCHGPGSIHVETNDPDDIKGSLTAKDCEKCHNSTRVGAFRYKPLIYGGAH